MVSVHHAHTGKNVTVVVNTTEYIYVSGIDEWGNHMCQENIEFRVRAVNIVGEGNQSEALCTCSCGNHGRPRGG